MQRAGARVWESQEGRKGMDRKKLRTQREKEREGIGGHGHGKREGEAPWLDGAVQKEREVKSKIE